MGIIPATGSEIAMGKVRNAYGLTGQVTLRGNLGAQISSGSASPFPFSISFGGRSDTPNNYA